jgi:RHS repeat-associated protein
MMESAMKKYLTWVWVLLGLVAWTMAQASTNWSAQDYDLYYGRFNGDGKDNILYISKDPTKASGIATTTSTTGDTFWQSWQSNYLGINWSTDVYNVVVGTFCGSAKTDILLQAKTSGNYSYILCADQYGKISGINLAIPSIYQGVEWTADKHKIIAGWAYYTAYYTTFLYFQPTTSSGANYILRTQNSSLFSSTNVPLQTWNATAWGLDWSTQSSNVFIGDFNGDYYEDILVQAKPKWVMIDYDVTFPVPTYPAGKNALLLNHSSGPACTADSSSPSPQFCLSTLAGGQAGIQYWSRNDFGVDWSPLSNTIVVGSNGTIYLVPVNSAGSIKSISVSGAAGLSASTVKNYSDGNGISSGGYNVFALSGNSLYMQSKSSSGNNYVYSPQYASSTFSVTTESPANEAKGLGQSAATINERTDGSAAVSANGEATYSIPLKLPSGSGGMVPKLSLVYGSNQGTATVGISGLSVIARCNSTMAQNGQNAAITLTTADRFCLDGNQLKLVNGASYGAAGSEYRTELDGISRIKVSTLSSAGDPTSFTVERKDGLIYEYGNSADSRIESIRAGFTSVARLWAVNKIYDRAGNTISFTYEEDGNPSDTTKSKGGYRVTAISYASNGATAAPYIISFEYNAKTTGEIIAERYLAAGKIVDRKRLGNITLKYTPAGVIVRQYRLSYESTATNAGRVRLHSIQECAGGTNSAAPIDCMMPTTFYYQDGNGSVYGARATAAYGDEVQNGSAIPSINGLMVIDINGDGRSDLVYPSTSVTSGSGTGYWVYRLADPNSSTGYAAAVTTTYTSANYDKAVVIDYNGDGRDDILVPDSSSTWYALLGSAAGLSSRINTGLNTAGYPVNRAIAMDYNGDGLDDLVWEYGAAGSQAIAEVNRLPSGGFAASPSIVGPSGYTSGYFRTQANWPVQRARTRDRLWDINGDGIADVPTLYCWATYTGYYGSASTGCSYKVIKGGSGVIDTIATPNSTSFNTTELINVNSDMYADFLSFEQDGKLHYRVAKGDSGYDEGVMDNTTAIGCSSVLGCSTLATANYIYSLAVKIDWNDDGFDDLLVPYTDSLSTWLLGNALHFDVGNGYSGINFPQFGATDASTRLIYDPNWKNSTTFESPQAIYRMDINGDGLDDIGYVKQNGAFAYRLHQGVKADLLTQVTDGYGNTTSFTYKSINQTGGCYSRDADPAYPTTMDTAAHIVVCKQTNTDAVGGTYDINYSYVNANRDLLGRGSLGFQKRAITDTRTGIKTTETYSQTFPYIGRLVNKTVAQSDGTLIQQVDNTYLTNSYGSGAETYQYPYLSQSVIKSYEVNASSTYNGKLVSTQTQTVSTPNAYGVSATSTTTVVEASTANGLQLGATYTVATAKSSMQDSSTTWCFDKPGTVTVTSSHSTNFGAAIVRTANRVWDTSSLCRLTSETTAPTTAYEVTRKIDSYDGFGNITQETVSDTDSTTPNRVTKTDWGTAGRFPQSITNAANEKTTFTWYDDIGRKKTVQGPNQTATTAEVWTYDNFGELTSETAADGTKTLYGATAECKSSNNYCSTGNALVRTTLHISHQDNNAGALSYEDRYLDRFERTVETHAPGLNGAVVATRTRYDNRGQAYQKSAPFFLGSTAYYATTTYDVLGRATASARFRSASDTTAVTNSVDYQGLTTVTTDPKGNKTSKITNVAGKVVKVIDPTLDEKRYEYDAFGSLKQVRDKDDSEIFAANYAYGVSAFQTLNDDKDHGIWTYEYYPTGELKKQTDAKSQDTTYAYDALGRQTTRTEAEGTTTWTWGSSASAYNVGQLETVESPSGYAERNCYDSVGRLSRKRIATNINIATADPGSCTATTGVDDATSNFTYDYAYDATTGLLDTLTYPTSTSSYRLKVKYNYQNGIMNKVLDANAATTVFWQANATDARGQLSDEQLGSNGRVYSVYDAVTGQPTARQTMAGSGASTLVANMGFAWDDNSNLQKRFDYQQGLTEEFTYDSRNVLDYSKLNGTTNLDVTVDALGNLTYKSDVGNYTYDATKKRRLMSTSNGWTFDYDANGNMTKYKGVANAVTWTSYNYPSSITANGENSQFYYGPNRELFKQVAQYVNGTETSVYAGGLLERVTGPGASGGTVTSFRHYIRAGNTTAIYTRFDNNAASETRYLTEDQAGSNNVILSDSGALLARLSYDAYGKRRGSNWTGTPTSTTGGDWDQISKATREGYTGHTELDNLGLIHMGGRVQDPMLGRFLSADPFVSDPDNTQNYNRYAYVYNNPLTYTDPSGFACTQYDYDDYYADGQYIGSVQTGVHDCGGFHDIPGGDSSDDNYVDPYTLAQQQEQDRQKKQAELFTKETQRLDCSSFAQAMACYGQSLDQVASNEDLQDWAFASSPIAPEGAVTLLPKLMTALKMFKLGKSAVVVAKTLEKGGKVEKKVAEAARGTTSTVKEGTTLFRVFGGEAKGLGQSWTTVNPGTVTNFREAAGLFPGNTGRFVIEGKLMNTEGVLFRGALPGPGGVGGGLSEVLVPNAGRQICIVCVSGVNPPF